MITKNPMQLKAIIKKVSIEKNISSQHVMQNYMMERLLHRLSISKYKNNFILKGGFLIASIVGLDRRATLDIDTTIKGFTLTHDSIRDIFEEVCMIKIEDDITFTIGQIRDIRKGDHYPGICITVSANYGKLKVPLSVDVTTGDKITPREIEYTFPLMFDPNSISLMAYNLETIIAEKIETVLSRNVTNTRPRDFYDLYILFKLRKTELDPLVLRRALEATAQKRGSLSVIYDFEYIISDIRGSLLLHTFWKNYQKEFEYAKGIQFEDTCETILQILSFIYP